MPQNNRAFVPGGAFFFCGYAVRTPPEFLDRTL
jgi:hypothetical protein